MTGLVGLKPTKGLVSTRGVVPACRSLDVVSVFARSVADAEAVLDVLAAYDAAGPYSRVPPAAAAPRAADSGGGDSFAGGRPPATPGAFTFGVPAAPHLTFDGDEASAEAFAAAVDAAVRRGGTAVEVDMAPLAAAAALLYGGPFVAERAAAVGSFLAAHPSTAEPAGTNGNAGAYDAAGIDKPPATTRPGARGARRAD
ncbi:hypothetical protein I4F81_011681 [Pyropia yezoensis]|uniref:Uncharacterized protein n=1 Tax=Pyropia yezoensis TaxID=2788 RepID=A0ACC3CGI0_PYRYE|nr:hypothetical protein I4F81_011681 [Neopyropia yezoensis]